MADEAWRLFIGVLLPDQARADLADLQQALRSHLGPIRWVSPENLHVTLHFLGDVAPGLVAALQSALGEALRAEQAPGLALAGLGGFPDLRQPRVVWAGLSGAVGGLARLHQRAVAAGRQIGIQPEQRPFHPHITLGYVARQAAARERAACGAAIAAQRWPAPPPTLPYPDVALIRSVLGRAGATHTPLATWSLSPLAPPAP